MSTTTERPVGRLLLAAAAVPLVLTAAAAVLLGTWRDELPDPVARHWGSSGADGFSSLGGTITLLVVISVVVIGFGAVLALAARDRWSARAAAGIGAGTSAFIAATVTLAVAGQRGLADAAESTFSGWWALVAIAIGVAVGIGCAALVPFWSSVLPDADATEIDAVDLGANERATWSRTVGAGLVTVVVVAAAVIAIVATAVLTELWWTLAVTVPILMLVGALMSVRVVVDAKGVSVRGRFGWPRLSTSIEAVERADVVHVNAIRDFGGYGVRLSVMGPHRGTRGIVLRGGEALRLLRTDGGRELVVVDDATTAAALVNGLRGRAGLSTGER